MAVGLISRALIVALVIGMPGPGLIQTTAGLALVEDHPAVYDHGLMHMTEKDYFDTEILHNLYKGFRWGSHMPGSAKEAVKLMLLTNLLDDNHVYPGSEEWNNQMIERYGEDQFHRWFSEILISPPLIEPGMGTAASVYSSAAIIVVSVIATLFAF